jgi:4-amino-4-deoxy-L-arabinose transferase-like glycosyltransferase
MIAVLRRMTVALPIFHGSDELVYHYPTILRFARELPFPDLHRYGAAQTPLFHLLMAYIGKVTGYQLWRLRLVQVLISYLLALAVFGLLRRRVGLTRQRALALTLLFVLSPYVFGQSFRLGTDNLALLFAVVALDRFEAFRERDGLAPFLAGCAAAAAAMLTRQSTAFLPVVALCYAFRPSAKLDARTRLMALLAVAASCVPIGALFISWHGLVPVGGDPGSCGLCAAAGTGTGLTAHGLEVQTLELSLATIGLYGLVLFGPQLAKRLLSERHGDAPPARRLADHARGAIAGAGLGAALLLAFPARPGSEAAGDIWKIGAHLPAIDGTSLLFWVLVPVAVGLLWTRLRCSSRPWTVGVVAACFLASTVAIRYPWQKYVDPFALLILFLSMRPAELESRWALSGVALLAIVFVAYTVDYSSHRSTPHPPPRKASASVASTPGASGSEPVAPAQLGDLGAASDWL